MKSIKYFLAFCMVVIIVSGCADKKTEVTVGEKKAAPPDEVVLTADQYKVAGIELGQVEMRNIGSVIKVNGLIDVPPQNVVSVSAPMGGYLRSAGLLPGQAVRRGQALAVIENAAFIEMQQEYLEAKSRMVFLTQELKRQEELRKEEVNAAKTLQQVSSEYNMLKAKMSGLEQKLSLIGISAKSLASDRISKTSNLYSPINGFVTASNVNRGKYVQPSDVLFELADKSDMHLALQVFEKDVRKLAPGQPIRFALANETDYNRHARVYLIGKAANPDGTIPVHCHLSVLNDPAMLPGMYVKALIETRSDKTTALPVSALVQSEGKDYIFIATDTTQKKYAFKMIPVVKGPEQEGFVAVSLPTNFSLEGKVVVKGAYSLLSAMKNVEE